MNLACCDISSRGFMPLLAYSHPAATKLWLLSDGHGDGSNIGEKDDIACDEAQKRCQGKPGTQSFTTR